MQRQPSLALHPVQRSAVKVFAWGRGDLGQLGLMLVAGSSQQPQPQQPAGDDGPSGMQVDGEPSTPSDCALLPVCVDLLDGKDVVHVAAGPFNTAFLTAEGEVYTCGAHDSAQLGVRRHMDNSSSTANGCSAAGCPVVRVDALDVYKVAHVAYGEQHALAVTDKGALLAWGTGEYGQLGMGPSVTTQAQPRLIKGLAKPPRFARVAAGAYFSVGLSSNGQVYTWGQGSYGALGHGDEQNMDTPKHLQRLWHEGIVQVACGEHHCAALTAEGRVYAWGRGKYGALGCGEFLNSPVPQLVKALKGIKQIACGGDHTLALTQQGMVYAWGRGHWGQLGLGSTDNTCSPNRVLGALEGHTVLQVAAGLRHSAALTASGQVLVWGCGEQGQLGNTRTQMAQLSPAALPSMALPSNMPPLYITAGGDHMVAVVTQHPTPGQSMGPVAASCVTAAKQHPHGHGVLPLLLPDLKQLTAAAATEMQATSSKQGTQGPGQGVGPATTQLLLAIEDVFTSPGYLTAMFTPADGHTSSQQRHEEVVGQANQNCGVKPYTLDVEAVTEVFQALLRLYSPEVVACLGSACLTLLDNMERLLRDGNETGLGLDHSGLGMRGSPTSSAQKKFKAVARPDQQNWLMHGSVLPALFVLAQNPLNAAGSAAVAGSPSGSPSSSVGAVLGLWSKLADVINQLHPSAQKTLCHWLVSLPPDIFGGRVLRPLQAHITRCVERGMTRWRADILAAAKVVQQLYGAHTSLVDACCSWGCTSLLDGSSTPSGLHPLPSSEWNNKALSEAANLRDEYIINVQVRDRFYSQQLGDALVSLCQVPVLLTPEAKSLIMQGEAREQKQAIIHNSAFTAMLQGINPHAVVYMDVHVRRSSVMQDALQQILARPEDLKKPLRVTFIGPSGVPEEGLDEGGVSREFFQLLVADLFREEYGMFVWNEETRTFWFNPNSLESELEFTLVGAVLGLAIYNGIILDVHLPMVTYKKLLGHQPGWRDLCEAQPSLARGLAALLSFEGDVEATFCRTFEVEYDYFGETRRKELMPGGARVPVTKDNRLQYVQLYTKWLLEDSIDTQFKAFLQGFHQVCGGPALGLLSPPELELLVCGLPHLDFAALEAGARYDGGYTAETQVVRWFWTELRNFTLDQKKRFLMFTTGCDRAPVGGLGKLTLILQRSGPDSNRLPSAHTCFNVLLLPEYSSQAKVRERLLTAIDNAQGFGLQ